MNNTATPPKQRAGYDPRLRNVEPYARGIVREETKALCKRFDGFYDVISEQALSDLSDALKGTERMGKTVAEYLSKRLGAVADRHLTFMERQNWVERRSKLSRPHAYWRRHVFWRPSQIISKASTPEQYEEMAFTASVCQSRVSLSHSTVMNSNLPMAVSYHVLTRMVERYATRTAPLTMLGPHLTHLLGLGNMLILLQNISGYRKIALPLGNGMLLGKLARTRSTDGISEHPYNMWREARNVNVSRSELVTGSKRTAVTDPTFHDFGDIKANTRHMTVAESGYFNVDEMFRNRVDSDPSYVLAIKLNTFLPYDMLDEDQDWVVQQLNTITSDHPEALRCARELYLPSPWRAPGSGEVSNDKIDVLFRAMETLVDSPRWRRALGE